MKQLPYERKKLQLPCYLCYFYTVMICIRRPDGRTLLSTRFICFRSTRCLLLYLALLSTHFIHYFPSLSRCSASLAAHARTLLRRWRAIPLSLPPFLTPLQPPCLYATEVGAATVACSERYVYLSSYSLPRFATSMDDGAPPMR